MRIDRKIPNGIFEAEELEKNLFSIRKERSAPSMSILFQTSEINGMTLSNRFVRSATWEGMAAEREGAA